MLQQVLTVKNNHTVFVNKTVHIRANITPSLSHYEFDELPSADINAQSNGYCNTHEVI